MKHKSSPSSLMALAFGLCAFFGASACASEALGKIQLTDLTLRPQAYFQEGQRGDFEWGESSAQLQWSLEESLKAAVRFGASSLRGRPLFYNSSTQTANGDLDLIEAYGEYEGLFGRFRMGLLPMEIGREAVLEDHALIFPRSQVYSQGVFGLHDLGLNYLISYRHFYTSFTVHNGESGSDVDNRSWFSARWGYDFRKLRLEFFGQTGSTTPSSTAGSSFNVAQFDPSLESKWRLGGFYLDWVPSRFRMAFEAEVGDVQQERSTHRLASGHFDVGQMGESFGLFFRYNPFDPDVKTHNDTIHRLSLATIFPNSSKTSQVILVGTKILEEGRQIGNDEIRLIWRLSPFYQLPNY